MRIILSILIPIIIPTILYMLWVRYMRWQDISQGKEAREYDPPWSWLIGTGMLLALIVVAGMFMLDDIEYVHKAPAVDGEWVEPKRR